MKAHSSALRDFTVNRRVWLLSGVAILIGAGAAVLAVVLLAAIHFATNIFYYHRFSFAPVMPAGSPLGNAWMILVPVVGGILVGLLARYGSEKIRGHGIPEAIEAVLLHGARVRPSLAILKPLSAAISIGSGGPFGAEGPIIMTGGAFGSLIAQWIKLTDAERTTLLVAGSAAGMSATFAAPLASVLLAVELLLFEWRPRSLVPVAIASAVADLVRRYWLGAGPIFPMTMHTPAHAPSPWIMAPEAIAFGMLTGLAAAVLSKTMYLFEDLFGKLPIHWMWWPAIGGIGIGIGGYFFPRGLGVGYENIAQLLAGHGTAYLIFGLLIAKSLMWTFSLGSGTSGGVLAPLLMIGGGFGAMFAYLAHGSPQTQAMWALLGMASMLSASLGVPLTAIVFALELTHALPAMLPLLLASMAAYLVSTLILPRSILTERLSRRGYHVTREYGIDPLETISVAEIMDTHENTAPGPLPTVFAYSDETCREVAERMATTGHFTMPVLDRELNAVSGSLTIHSLLAARQRSSNRERDRTRQFRLYRPSRPDHREDE